MYYSKRNYIGISRYPPGKNDTLAQRVFRPGPRSVSPSPEGIHPRPLAKPLLELGLSPDHSAESALANELDSQIRCGREA